MSSGDGFRYEINPQSQQAQDLSSWYERQEADVFSQLPYFSKVKSEVGNTGVGNTPVMTLAEGMELIKGKPGKAEFFVVCFILLLILYDIIYSLFLITYY